MECINGVSCHNQDSFIHFNTVSSVMMDITGVPGQKPVLRQSDKLLTLGSVQNVIQTSHFLSSISDIQILL